MTGLENLTNNDATVINFSLSSFILQSMSANKARRFLNSIGHRYTIESVLKSEMRVLKTLEYHLMITTPLNYLETILEILGIYFVLDFNYTLGFSPHI